MKQSGFGLPYEMPSPAIHIWKKAPFIRFLVPMMGGILLQWYLQIQSEILWGLFLASLSITLCFFFIPFFKRFKLSVVNGLSIAAMFIAIGGLLSWYKNIQHDDNWFGKKYEAGNAVIVTLNEDLVEKTNSFKAIASVNYILKNDSWIRTKGTIILYFEKDSLLPNISYGSQLVINKRLHEIKNSGNPGGFDYRRYSLFQGVTHQVYLRTRVSKENQTEFVFLSSRNIKILQQFINSIRTKVLGILRANIKGEKELGLAEALLIGYKNDLDKTLVQSYSNTGVVHVIAISGLHLGLIYWLLTWLFKPLQKRRLRWLRPVFILTGLWLFSLLAGAQPSVLRSAVMFTCIVLSDSLDRRSPIFNGLALSALLVLCLNPFWLWDVGFQLSYAAVLSIVIFMQPIYHLFYFKNKVFDFTWKLNAVTIAAQILTAPIGIYHFHQFPATFLLTNFLAVPLSSFILLAEILLCIISIIPSVAVHVGKMISWLIWLMNSYIGRIELLPYSLWDGLQISIPQALSLLVVVSGLGYWLIEKNKAGLKYGLLALLTFMILRTYSFAKASDCQQLIVYNVPKKQAIDIIDGRKYFFIGDSNLFANDFIRNFHIKPSRILHRVGPVERHDKYHSQDDMLIYRDHKILLLKETKHFSEFQPKLPIDLLIISNNSKLFLNELAQTFSIKQVVFDGSCPAWKIIHWKKDCNSLRIANHDVSEKGAFVMNLR